SLAASARLLDPRRQQLVEPAHRGFPLVLMASGALTGALSCSCGPVDGLAHRGDELGRASRRVLRGTVVEHLDHAGADDHRVGEAGDGSRRLAIANAEADADGQADLLAQ